ncbi:type II toxin-antitoxin system MqsA family antitoxin [Pleomorphomonas sp. JP5]|uniref:type II toxin-antitoxin system MqsA family antitoxin n=1 Tax=Pleomorphomonas sp. JP5 TaxID=2942998 RepID=UPI002042DDAD|nr:type II toxin-antitoxin system MqsA family antitoxin [Pleomorphomonas sp. JP5]MCM5557736.1 type II toxin-antitoxin system MqsA family antitoxin [Pleomorphomonas sp. JP5]
MKLEGCAMDTMISPETGRPLTFGVRPTTFTFGGRSLTVDMPGWYGEDEEDAIFDKAGQTAYHRAMTVLKARASGLLEPSDVRRIRRKLKLSQRDASARLGGGPAAFQKYEAGDVLVSQAMSNLLRLLDRDPSLLDVLSQEAA